MADKPRKDKMKMMTRPQDWAPPARAYLFGMHTLSDAERERELIRRAAYPDRYKVRRRG